MKKKTFPVEEIAELLDQGFKIADLAKHFQTSRPTMGKFLKEHNLQTSRIRHYEKCQNLNVDEIIQNSCSVTGTLETCSYFKQYFDNVGFFAKRHKDEKNNYTYQIGGRNRVRTALSKLYSVKDHLSFFYQRKYKIYTKLSVKS